LLRTVRAGFAHHRAGRLRRAEALYRKALSKDPEHADALHLLGVIAYQCGMTATAIRLIERALPELQNLPDAHLNHGNALRHAGRLADALASYRRAIALKSDYGMAHSNLADALNEQGDYGNGLASAKRALDLIPEFFGAHVNCATALIGLERFAEAESPLRRALDLAPDRAETYRDLGWILAKLGRFDEAVKCHERGITLEPTDPSQHCALAATLHLAEDPAASEASFRHALSLDPDYPRTLLGLGNLLRVKGDFDEALFCFRRALEVAPGLPEVHRSLAVTGQRSAEESHLHHLKATLASAGHPVPERISAGFALGALLDTAGRYDEAFPCFAQANTLYRQQRSNSSERFDPTLLRAEVDDLIAFGTPALFSAVAEWGSPSETPVFIVGMPRSGTSLVEQIAASHSRVFGAGERREINAISDALAAYNRGTSVEKWEPIFPRQVADRHVAHLQELGKGVARVIDKMPDNVFALWLIAALFPSARVIFCRRDLRDVCLSCYFHWFTEGHLYAYDLADCGRRALEVERLMAHWLRALPLPMLVIDYEALVADIEGESRRMIEFLGLDWEAACLDFHRTQRPVFTASAWQVRQPLYNRSVGRWHHYQRHLTPLLQILAQRSSELLPDNIN
jgi:tetratricopeptide (TPR) repeat protein